MKLLPLTGITTLLLTVVTGEKWDFMKEGDRKKFEKKKEFRNVEEYKKENYEKYSKYDIKKYKNTDLEPTTEKFLKNEKDQLCQSLEEDNVKNTLLKFGLITHLVENVSQFKKLMKILPIAGQKFGGKADKSTKSRTNARTDKEMIKQKGGANVKLQQSNFVGRSLKLLSPLNLFYDEGEGSNYLEEQIERRKRDTKMTRDRKGTLKIPLGQVPKCYGWKYLSALDAMIDNQTVDTDYLSQSMSDMLDMTFSSSVSSIFEACEAALEAAEEMCPALEYPDTEDTEDGAKCPDKCQPDLTAHSPDCAYGEICCKAACGGLKCIKPEGKNRSAKSEKCSVGDKFMQCVYQKIDTQICSDG